MPFVAMRSICGTTAANSALAASLLPASMAFITLRIEVRTFDRNVTLWARRLTA